MEFIAFFILRSILRASQSSQVCSKLLSVSQSYLVLLKSTQRVSESLALLRILSVSQVSSLAQYPSVLLIVS